MPRALLDFLRDGSSPAGVRARRAAPRLPCGRYCQSAGPLDLDAGDRIGPAVYAGPQVAAALDALVVGDQAALGERGVARCRARLARGDPNQALAWRDEVGKVLGVALGVGVVAGGAGDHAAPYPPGQTQAVHARE